MQLHSLSTEADLMISQLKLRIRNTEIFYNLNNEIGKKKKQVVYLFYFQIIQSVKRQSRKYIL